MQGEDLVYRAGLNQVAPLHDRLSAALAGAHALDVAVAYAKVSGTGLLLKEAVPKRSRAVIGLGFGLTDPPAVERLAEAGVAVRCVADGAAIDASQFHPKLYLASQVGALVVLAGSANLTGGGLTGNVEQYEELRLSDPSAHADEQRERYERLWDYGTPLEDLRASGDWEEYRQRARDRQRLERENRRRVLRLDRDTGRLIGRLARAATRRAPGYVGITHPDWWDLQLQLRDQADRALFWRRNTNKFRALGPGGVFFHLVRESRGREELRSVAGYSTYPGVYETGEPRELWRRYGRQLGVEHLGELYQRLQVEAGRTLGVIHLEQLTELDRPVPLEELRANGVPFAPNIVSGRTLTLEEVAQVLQLGGLGEQIPRLALAAEERPEYRAEQT
jgi:HKD family nuclease